MEDAMPIVPKAGKIICHTGNIVQWTRVKRRMRQTSTAELSECMSDSISSWLKNQDRNELQSVSEVECFNKAFMEKVTDYPEKRGELKITAKIFLSLLDEDSVRDALQYLLEELGCDSVDTVILSVPEPYQTLEHIGPLYQILEDMENVFSVGLADFNKENLEEVFNWAKVKPMMNQVNLAHCCVIPPELAEYAKENNIELLTHSDDKDILPDKNLQDVLSQVLTPRDAVNWRASWVVRYSGYVKMRGVVKTKGYISCATRDTKLGK